MNTPFAPHTPGNMFNTDTYSPYQPSPSPSPSPYHLIGTPSPTGYSPATPGAPQSPYNPQTPGAGLDSQMGDWCTTDIIVKIRSHDDMYLSGQTGYIRTVNNGNCSVFLPAEDRVVTVLSENLEPVEPSVGDHFKVILGEERETTGTFISLSGGKEGFVSINGKNKLFPLNFLCKMKSD
jgi:transcription elongation factor SPT5